MEDNQKKSGLLQVIFWLAALGCFAFGYYNTVMGLRMFDAFGSSYGSWFLAIIPLVMVFGGYFASVQGRRNMLYLYLIGEVLFFVFNLTYLYPHYLGRTLVNEEAKVLADKINTMPNELDKIAIKGDSQALAKLKRLREFQTNLLTEIKYRRGFGDEARKQLSNFNELAGTKYTPERHLARTKKEAEEMYARWKKNTDEGIRSFLMTLNGNDKAAENLVSSKFELDSLVAKYGPKLKLILEDNTKVSIEHDDVNNNPQIKLMKDLTTDLDGIAKKVNSATQSEPFTLLVSGKETIAFPKTQKLGTFEHTIISVKERISKLDTWGVIIVCFFFDLLGPFLFYFYLRKEDDENGYDPGVSDKIWEKPWWKKLF